MNDINRKSQIENQQSAMEPGRLDPLDELFNALHGVGDVDVAVKELVISIICDIHGGGPVISAVEGPEKKEMICQLVKIIAAALHNRPETAKAVLARWMEELKALAAGKSSQS